MSKVNDEYSKRNAKLVDGGLGEYAVSALGVGQWDAVIMAEVLEHLYLPDKKMSEIAKLLKPDGVFLGSATQHQEIRPP